jgi:hypothetical protein
MEIDSEGTTLPCPVVLIPLIVKPVSIRFLVIDLLGSFNPIIVVQNCSILFHTIDLVIRFSVIDLLGFNPTIVLLYRNNLFHAIFPKLLMRQII